MNTKHLKNILFVVLIMLWFFIVLAKFDVNFERTLTAKSERDVLLADNFISYTWALRKEEPEKGIYLKAKQEFIASAQHLYKKVLIEDSENARAVISLAVLSYESGNIKECKIYIEKANKLGAHLQSRILNKIFVKKEKEPTRRLNEKIFLIENLFDGEAKDKILLHFYSLNNLTKDRELLEQKKEKRGVSKLISIFLLLCVFCILFLLGAAFLFLFLFKAKKYKRYIEEKLQSKISLQAAFLIFIIWDVLHIAVGLILYGLGIKISTISSAVFIYSLLSFFILFLMLKINNRDFLKNSVPFSKGLFWGFAGYCAILPMALIGAIINNFIFKGAEVSTNPIFNLLGGGGRSFPEMMILMIMVVVLGPGIEEIIFRGYLFTSFRKYFNFGLSLVIVSFLFSFIHADLFALVPILFIGFVLGAVYEYTGSIIASFIAHALWNFNTFLVFMLLFE